MVDVPPSVALLLVEIAFSATAAPTPGPPCTASASAIVSTSRLVSAITSRPLVVTIVVASEDAALVSSSLVPAIAAATVTLPSGVCA